MLALGDAPAGQQVASRPLGDQAVQQWCGMHRAQRPHGDPCRRWDLAEVGGQEVGEDVVGDHPRDPRLVGGGADRQAATQRDAEQRHLLQAEVVQDRAEGPGATVG
jgi:hypothetical protein